MSELVLEVKPKFYLLSRVVANIRKENALAYILEVLFFTFFVVFKQELISSMLERNEEECFIYLFTIAIVVLFISYLVSIVILGFLDKKNFEVTSYKVYNDKIDFEEGFINHKHSSILFKDVKEIHLDQNFIQRKYNVATIRFITAANNPMGETSIRFQDIENVQYVYTKVKEIHEG